MGGADLVLVAAWMHEPHVVRWYLHGSTLHEELEDLRLSVEGRQPTQVLVVEAEDRPVGWCQWYCCDDYLDYAVDIDALPGDIGIDYALGDPGAVGHGVGTGLVAALVDHVRIRFPDAGFVADPEASNWASRRVLEKNGFDLVAVRIIASEPVAAPMAIYRRPPPS
jgi:aminoglycoside 6'-N-acetyltransferase